jgi:peptidyl-prolyl cis-trans isomerase SurA
VKKNSGAANGDRPAFFWPARSEVREFSGSLLPAVLLAAAVFLAASCLGCSRQKEDEEAVAWVNGETILFSAYWDEIRDRYSEVTDASSPQQDVLLVLKRKVLNDMIRERVLLQEASRRGITVSEEALDARVNKIKAGYTDSPFHRSLMQRAMDYDRWRRSLLENMIMEALYDSVVRDAGEPTEEEIREYYQQHLDEFLNPEAVQLSQIVVKNRAAAETVLRRIRKGQSFEELAEKYSIGPEREESGRLGTYHRGELPEPLETAAFSTPTGKVTSPVETQDGFHLLKVVSRIPSHLQTEKEARAEVVRKLSQAKKQALYDQWAERLFRDSDIRVHASLAPLTVQGEPTNPFQDEATREPE